MEPCFLTATQLASQLKAGTLTVTQIAESHLGRINSRDADVQGWAFLDPKLVLQRAQELDNVPVGSRGPLHGIPVAAKDVIYTKDMPTQHNSPIYAGDRPEIDAACIATLRALGALIFGKSTTTEFAATTRGPATRNPYHSERTPGGSSSGSGAVVGDFQCTFGLGTQTIGSTIRPASFNNIFGMKPTWNAISREGLKMLSASLDTLGLYTRCAEDLETLCKAFQICDDIPPKSIGSMRIGMCKSPVWTDNATGSLETVWGQAEKLLTQAGATVETLELPPDFDGAFDAARTIMWTEARSAFLSETLKAPDICHEDFKTHVENRKNLSRQDQLAAYDLLNRLKPSFDEIASQYDIIITPSATGEAPLGVTGTGSAIFCGIWTGLGVPVINVPGFAGENGMPIGLSLVSGRYKDGQVIAASKEIAKVFSRAHNGEIRCPAGAPKEIL